MTPAPMTPTRSTGFVLTFTPDADAQTGQRKKSEAGALGLAQQQTISLAVDGEIPKRGQGSLRLRALGAGWMGVACMRVRNPGCAFVLAGLLAGCAVGPDYQTPDAAVPVAFLTQPAIKEPGSGGASPDRWQWWRTLHDPQLNGLIERALRNNLDLKIALDRLQQARLQLVVIGGQALPELNGSAGGGVGT